MISLCALEGCGRPTKGGWLPKGVKTGPWSARQYDEYEAKGGQWFCSEEHRDEAEVKKQQEQINVVDLGVGFDSSLFALIQRDRETGAERWVYGNATMNVILEYLCEYIEDENTEVVVRPIKLTDDFKSRSIKWVEPISSVRRAS